MKGKMLNIRESGRKRTPTKEKNAFNAMLSVVEEEKSSVPKLSLNHNPSEIYLGLCLLTTLYFLIKQHFISTVL